MAIRGGKLGCIAGAGILVICFVLGGILALGVLAIPW